MKILITGTNGYIGCHVLKGCLAQGYHEISAVDFSFNDIIPTVTYYREDILLRAKEKGLYDELGAPDVIIHLAWQDGFNHNAESHMDKLPYHYHFIKNMIDSGCKSITVMGSVHEIGYYEGEVTNDTPCNPLSLYGIAKNTLRQALMTYVEGKNISFKWLRAFYITGDDEHNKSIFTKILEMSQKGEKTFPFTDGLNKYDFIEVDKLATYIVNASVQNDINSIINVCSGKPISLRDKVEEFIAEKHLDIKPNYGAFPIRKYDSPAIWGNTTLINKIMESKND